MTRRKILSLWILRVSDTLSSFSEIVVRMLEVNVRSEQKPISTGLSKRHSYTTCIDDSSLSHGSIKLHMGVPTDDQRDVKFLKDR